jgi:MFS superfamily sulfate permease-like transporter
VIRGNFHSAVSLTQNGSHYLLRLQRDASFLNKAPLRDALARIDRGGYVIIDGTRARFIDQDILETIEDFIASAGQAGITVEIKKVDGVDSLASRTG